MKAWKTLEPPLPLSDGLGWVLGGASVAEAETVSFSRPHAFLGREVSTEAQMLAREAREVHRETGYGFWDALIARLDRAGHETRVGVLRNALAHDVQSYKFEPTRVDELLTRLRSGHYADLPAREVVALSSRVKSTAGDVGHLPMLDFWTESASVALDILEVLGCQGVLLSSGRSFHYIGDRIVSDADLTSLLASAQLVAPAVDQRWVAHQILNRYCSLRISTDSERHRMAAKVVAMSQASSG